MVGVAGLEPAASWSRRFGWKFNGRFQIHLMLFVPQKLVFEPFRSNASIRSRRGLGLRLGQTTLRSSNDMISSCNHWNSVI